MEQRKSVVDSAEKQPSAEEQATDGTSTGASSEDQEEDRSGVQADEKDVTVQQDPQWQDGADDDNSQAPEIPPRKMSESSSERSPRRVSATHKQSSPHKEREVARNSQIPSSTAEGDHEALTAAASMSIPLYAPVGK